MLSHGDTPICKNLVWLCQKTKTACQTQIHDENIILKMRSMVKVKQCSWIQSMTMSKTKSWGLNTKPCHKPYKFDFEVKGLHRIRIMNVLHTSFHSDRPMCQIWYVNVKANRSHSSDMTKAFQFDLEVKGQMGNMKVHVTSSHGHRPICQIW